MAHSTVSAVPVMEWYSHGEIMMKGKLGLGPPLQSRDLRCVDVCGCGG